jgi:hypothetical protein
MALLYGHLDPGRPGSGHPPIHLPTEHELSERDRVTLELGRLECLLTQLSVAVPADPAHPIPPDAAPLRAAWHPPADASFAAGWATAKLALRTALVPFNLSLLAALGCVGPEPELAYELGRALRDTANPPGARDAIAEAEVTKAVNTALSRPRVNKLQQWLFTLTPLLPADAGPIVGASLGRWSAFAWVVLHPKSESPGALRKGTIDAQARQLLPDLLEQGDVWLNLLIGTEPTSGLLTPESYVAAGEASLSRTARIIRRVLVHYWVALIVLAVALAFVLWLSATYLGGAGRVWTEIAAIAGALGVTAKGIGSSVGRLTEAAEKPIYQLEEVDAMAWAITMLPKVELTPTGVHALRRSGIQRSAPLGHV